jgi:hypothetical protein
MRIGETEIPDVALEAALKASGQRLVKEEDYTSKAEQAAIVAKLRAALGDRVGNIDELAGIVKAHDENVIKSKSQVELATAAAKELEKQLAAERGNLQNLKMQMRKRDIDEWFREGQEVFNTKIIEPILEPFKKELLNLKDEEIQNVELVKGIIKEKLDKAGEIQKGELVRLGLAGISPSEGQSFGGGQTNLTVKESKGVAINNATDLWSISKQAAASPMGWGQPKK